ncbi:MAG TPA: hypothetical protein VFW34_06120 [Candidatus Rubrimentiphilum sp.]|nr:hypothetical protein [Candidatus Rubrimentiphilum sp.]
MEHAPPDRVVDCTSLVSHAHSRLLAAERYAPTTSANAYARWSLLGDLVDVGDPEVTDVLADSNERWFFIGSCNRQTVDLFAVYFEWADILADQASTVFMTSTPRCTYWVSAIVRSKIANHAAYLSALISRLGSSNPDLRHLVRLLKVWAHRYGMELPPLSSRDKTAQFQSLYERQYDTALAKASTQCQ